MLSALFGPWTRARWQVRRRVVLLAGVAAVVVAAVVVVPGLGTAPAYSVSEGNSGEVHVEINRPEDAAGLERALAERGITADVTYFTDLARCAPGHYQVSEFKRSEQPADGDERNITLGWLAFHRDALKAKCLGLSSEQVVRRSAGPSRRPDGRIGAARNTFTRSGR
jgi:hypothetical protein